MSIYTRGQAIDFIERVFGEGKPSNGGLNLSVSCPVCVSKKSSGYVKKKLVIRTDNFVSHCWVCGSKAKNLVPLLRKWYPQHLPEYIKTFVQGDQLTDIEDGDTENQPAAATLPVGFRLIALSGDNDIPATRVKRYLSRRGIYSQHDFWYWKLGITTEDEDLEDRVIIPSFDSEGVLNYWTARSTQKGQKPKYVNPPVDRTTIIFNEINLNWKKPLTLVEGPFDLLKCNENATCLLGSAFTPDYLLFRKIVENSTPVVLAMDEDAKHKALHIAKTLSEYDVPVTFLWVPPEKGDVGAMTKEEFRSLYARGIPYDTNTYLLQKIRLSFGQEYQ
jgi:hypothetical protein